MTSETRKLTVNVLSKLRFVNHKREKSLYSNPLYNICYSAQEDYVRSFKNTRTRIVTISFNT